MISYKTGLHLNQWAFPKERPQVVWSGKATPRQPNQTGLKFILNSRFPKMSNAPRHSLSSNQKCLVLEEKAGEWQQQCPVLHPHWAQGCLATRCDAFLTFWQKFSTYLSLRNSSWIADNCSFLICWRQKHKNSCRCTWIRVTASVVFHFFSCVRIQ